MIKHINVEHSIFNIEHINNNGICITKYAIEFLPTNDKIGNEYHLHKYVNTLFTITIPAIDNTMKDT